MSCSQASAASLFAMDLGPRGPPCKLASLQEFIPHRSDASELGFSRYAMLSSICLLGRIPSWKSMVALGSVRHKHCTPGTKKEANR